MIQEFDTRSGSTYQVDRARMRIRRLVRSRLSTSERVGEGEWCDVVEISDLVIGKYAAFGFGTGRDQYSANAEQIGHGDDCDVVRIVNTTPVVAIRDVPSVEVVSAL